MKRVVQPELLDTLPPGDPRAVRSRRDLRRINALMLNHALMAQTLEKSFVGCSLQQITELGAGDGDFLLRVARKISRRWPDRNVTLLDLQATVSAGTLAAFAKLGWRAEVVVADVFGWPRPFSDVVVANLFLHHFENRQLMELLQKISKQAKLFVAIEPRRAAWPLFCSRLLWAIGCNAVTQHDAVVSVRAGFAGGELSALWPDKSNWHLTETRAGPFSHLFIARRRK